jgi:hypothetical protein
VPLAAHAELVADVDRREPLSILAQQDSSRLAELVPIRYGRMSRTPFTFLRGAAAVMASDLAAGPSTDLQVELCGDAHLGNFRLYLSPDRRLVFDLNDFDETLPGPFEWDVKRLAASITVAARNSGFSQKQTRAATRYAMRNYREFIGEAAGLNPLDLYYYRFGAGALVKRIRRYGKRQSQKAQKTLKKAARKNSLRALHRYTDIVSGRRVIVPDPPLVVPVEEHLAIGAPNGISALFERYCETLPLDRRLLLDRFTPVDVAKKVVGVGSVGTRCLILLLEAGDGTPLFLQFKQAVASVLEPRLGALRTGAGLRRRLLLSPALGRQGKDRCGNAAAQGTDDLRGPVRQDARVRTRPLRGRHDDPRLHRRRRELRRRDGRVRRPLRRPNRGGPPPLARGDRRGGDRGGMRHLSLMDILRPSRSEPSDTFRRHC